MTFCYHVDQILYAASAICQCLRGAGICYLTVIYVTVLFLRSPVLKMPEASVQGTPRSGKAAQPPHALALYQEQITMAHGASSQEVKQQQPSGQAGKQQQPYIPQADREQEGRLTSSPRVRPRSPSAIEKDGTHHNPTMPAVAFIFTSQRTSNARRLVRTPNAFMVLA